MPTRTSQASWKGSIAKGQGSMRLGSGAWEGAFDVPSRFENGEGTNPEELIAAAHAGCFSMALSGVITRAGHEVRDISTSADVTVEKVDGDWTITTITLRTEGDIEGIDSAQFQEYAEQAKKNCPVSRALAGPQISLETSFKG